LAPKKKAQGHNNFYELSTGKSDPASNADWYKPEPWKVEVNGTVNKPRIFDVDDLAKFNPESSTYDFNLNTGILMVYAPERLQKEIQLYIDESMSIIKRQVLLEATIVEVVLNNEYKQGIDWSIFNSLSETGLALYKGAGVGGAVAALQRIVEDFTFSASRTFTAGSDEYKAFINPSSVEDSNNVVTDFTYSETVNADGTVTVQRDYTVARTNQRATHDRSGGLAPVNSAVPGAAFTGAFRLGDISAAVELLEEFGDAKVLSSPRISVLNNQPGLLRVVDEEVYFSVDVEEEVNEDTGNVQNRTYVLTENTVDVGFAMNVLPHITSGDEVFLNLKPSVTRVLGYRQSPSVSGVSGDNSVPITRVRELESVMTLRDGEIAVMGGLLEDRTGDNNQSVPGISKLPGIGNLFQNKSEKTYKTEFVVFIRAKIIKDPSIYGDYSDYRRLLPDSDFIVRDQENNILPPKQEDAR
jgi:MSHA type pilus biogenesis protein MshL